MLTNLLKKYQDTIPYLFFWSTNDPSKYNLFLAIPLPIGHKLSNSKYNSLLPISTFCLRNKQTMGLQFTHNNVESILARNGLIFHIQSSLMDI